MKNVIILLLFLLAVGESFGQGENNNWYFGNYAGITFGTNPPTVLLDNTIIHSSGAGTLNNKVTGMMMFTTDAKYIWNKNFDKMGNGAIPPSSVTPIVNSPNIQSGLIVPSIANRNQYYVFSMGASPVRVNYSIVDMELNNNLGDIVIGQKGIDLLDETGNPFTTESSAITVAPNNFGDAYWVLLYHDNYIYAYKIDATGLHTPVKSTLTFTNVTTNFNTSSQVIKVSPDCTRIGISTPNYSNYPNNGQLRIYSFNNASGTVNTAGAVVINDINANSLEFSPNNNLVFYTSLFTACIVADCTYTNILTCYDLVNATSRQITNTTTSNPLVYNFLQRTPADEIYFTISNNSSRYLSKITYPNDYNTTITASFLDLNPDYPNPLRTFGRFPQLIPKLNCALYEELKGNNITANYSYQVSNRITTSGDYAINSGQNINFYANNSIELKANTHLRSGSTVLGKIQACPAPANRISNTVAEETSIKSVQETKLVVYPNPSNDWVTVSLVSTIQSITITSIIDGKAIYNKENVSDSSHQLDCSHFTKGMYIVVVTSKEGKTFTEKMFKN